jgi:hypothetical protein
MRITDSRYDRDRQRLAVAYRMILLEARTRTIREATQLSDDRIRRMYRDYCAGRQGRRIRRHRGKSPRQMAFFRRSLNHEGHTSLLCSLLSQCELVVVRPMPFRPGLDDVIRFCDVYDTYAGLVVSALISFEHGWHLWQIVCRQDEHVVAACPDCGSDWLRDKLALIPYNCPHCRSGYMAAEAPGSSP